MNFADPSVLMGERKGGIGPKGWGLKDGKWTFVEGMKKGDTAYKKGGYTDFSDGYTNNEYNSITGSKVTLGPGGPDDWTESKNYYNSYSENRMHYGQWFSQINGNVSSNTASSFDFTAVDYNAGLKNINFEGYNAIFNLKLINVKGGFSFPYIAGTNSNIQGYLEGTVAEAKLSFGSNNLSTYIAARGLTGFVGANIQTNRYGFSADAGSYAALAELEGNWTGNSNDGRWGFGVTGTIPIGAYGGKGGGSYFYNPKNDSFSVGASGTVADGLGLGADFKFTIPNPFTIKP